MLEKDHFCEFEVAEELVFCVECGKIFRGDAI